jgi:hypothetical protein
MLSSAFRVLIASFAALDTDQVRLAARQVALDLFRVLRVLLLRTRELLVDLRLDDLMARIDVLVFRLELARLLELLPRELRRVVTRLDRGLAFDVLRRELRIRLREVRLPVDQLLLGLGRIELHHDVTLLDVRAVDREPGHLHRPPIAAGLRHGQGRGLERAQVASASTTAPACMTTTNVGTDRGRRCYPDT